MNQQRLVVIRIRGFVDVRKTVEDTMNMLRLYKKNTCVIINTSPACIGMLKKIKDYVTWGELDKETLKLLLQQRGRLPGNKQLTEDYLKQKTNLNFEGFADEFMQFKKELNDIPGLKRFFRLKPPEKGFEKKGIKKQYSLGGVLGYRKGKINELIRKML